MTDNFIADTQLIKESQATIEKLFEDRKKIQGNNTIAIDENIREQLIRMSIAFKNLREAHDNSKFVDKFSETELRRRIGLIMDYQDKYNLLKEYYEKEILLKEKNINTFTGRIKPDEDNKEEVALFLEKQQKTQDMMIGEFTNLIKKINNANREIEVELSNQTPMIADIDKNVTDVNTQIVSSSSKLDTYLEKSSNWCLLTTIVIEIIIIVLVLISY